MNFFYKFSGDGWEEENEEEEVIVGDEEEEEEKEKEEEEEDKSEVTTDVTTTIEVCQGGEEEEKEQKNRGIKGGRKDLVTSLKTNFTNGLNTSIITNRSWNLFSKFIDEHLIEWCFFVNNL